MPHNQTIIRHFLYSKRDLNPHRRNAQGILSPSCLPIPPFEHPLREERKTRLELAPPLLGRVVFYSLSCFRSGLDGDKDKTFL